MMIRRNGLTLSDTFGSIRARWTVCLLMVAVAPGCAGVLANLVNAAKGNTVPANYTGLKEKKVAVICVSNSESFGPAEASLTISRTVGKLLEKNIDKVTVVDPRKVAEWIDRNDWDYVDFKGVGEGVGAEMVVAIDLDTFSLHDGPVLYKGRADISMVVYDLTNGGKEVFAYTPNRVEYPENTSTVTTDMSERAFRNLFINVLSNRLARQFYAYDVAEDYARDASIIHGT